MTGGDLFKAASSRFVAAKRGRDLEAEEPRLDGPFRYTPTGELWVNCD